MEKINNYTKSPWIKTRCDCGDPMCNSYFISVAKSDGRFRRPDADIVILAPTLYEQHFKMLDDLKTTNNLKDYFFEQGEKLKSTVKRLQEENKSLTDQVSILGADKYCLKKEAERLQEENEQLKEKLHGFNNMCQQRLQDQLNEILPELHKLKEEKKELVDALNKAKPYVYGAYECAFPDESENDYVKDCIEKALNK